MELIIRPENKELAEVEVRIMENGKLKMDKISIKRRVSIYLLNGIAELLKGRRPGRIVVDIRDATFSSKRLGLAIGKTLGWLWGAKLTIDKLTDKELGY